MSRRRYADPQAKRWRRIIGQALRRLEDRIWLADSALGRLRSVRVLAERSYPKRFLAEGLAAKEILMDGCAAARMEFAGTPSAALLACVLGDGTVAGFAQRQKLRREKVHQKYWWPVLNFLVDYVLGREEGRRDAA